MWAKLKMWAALAVAALVAVMAFLLQGVRRQRDNAEAQRDNARREAETAHEINEANTDIQKAQQRAREEAAEHHANQTPATDRPTGDFGDPRLRNRG